MLIPICMGRGTSTKSLANIPKQFSIASAMALLAGKFFFIVA